MTQSHGRAGRGAGCVDMTAFLQGALERDERNVADGGVWATQAVHHINGCTQGASLARQAGCDVKWGRKWCGAEDCGAVCGHAYVI